MVEQPGKQPQTIGDALAQRMEVRRGRPSARAEAVRELGAVQPGRVPGRGAYPHRGTGRPASPPLERRGPLAPVAGDRRRDRRVRRQARTPRGAGGRARDRDDLGGCQSRHKACRWLAGAARFGPAPPGLALATYRCRNPPRSRPVTPRRRSRSPMPLAGTCRSWPCRSGCSRAGSPIRVSTPACTIRATWWSAPSWEPAQLPWSRRHATASPDRWSHGPVSGARAVTRRARTVLIGDLTPAVAGGRSGTCSAAGATVLRAFRTEQARALWLEQLRRHGAGYSWTADGGLRSQAAARLHLACTRTGALHLPGPARLEELRPAGAGCRPARRRTRISACLTGRPAKPRGERSADGPPRPAQGGSCPPGPGSPKTIFTARSRSSSGYFRCAGMTLHPSRDQSLQDPRGGPPARLGREHGHLGAANPAAWAGRHTGSYAMEVPEPRVSADRRCPCRRHQPV